MKTLLISVHKKAGKRGHSSSEPFRFKHAAVSSDHHLCSEVGKTILQKGGSAVDAVIAVQFCVEVVNSHSTGIGGGGFMIVYDKKTGKFIPEHSKKANYANYLLSGLYQVNETADRIKQIFH